MLEISDRAAGRNPPDVAFSDFLDCMYDMLSESISVGNTKSNNHLLSAVHWYKRESAHYVLDYWAAGLPVVYEGKMVMSWGATLREVN